MPTVFLSYRHEDDDHKGRVRAFAQQLRNLGADKDLIVIFDQFEQEGPFHGGGPDEGWPQWSWRQAERAQKILIIASPGWFDIFEGKARDASGTADEVGIIQQRLHKNAGNNPDIRVVKLAPLDREPPTLLARYHVFSADELVTIVGWLTATTSGVSVSDSDFPPAMPPLTWPLADRSDVRTAFAQLLTNRPKFRVLLIQGGSEHGKSFLTHQLLSNAVSFGLACGRFDFKGTAVDGEFAGFARHLRVSVGEPRARLSERLWVVLEELAEAKRPTLLIFDTYEASGQTAGWLKTQLVPSALSHPWLRIVVAGQSVPDWAGTTWVAKMPKPMRLASLQWEDWLEYGRSHHPDLTEDFVRTAFAGALGKPTVLGPLLGPSVDRAQQLRILAKAKGDPALLALATVDLVFSEVSDSERQPLHAALETAAIPHWSDEAILEHLLDPDLASEAAKLLAGLRNLTVVEPFPARGPGAVNVHEAARFALRARMASEAPDRLRTLSTRAFAHFAPADADHVRVEAVYHRLLFEPAEGATAVGVLLEDLDYRAEHDPLRALASALDELLRPEYATLLPAPVLGAMLYTVAKIRWDYPRPEDAVAITRPLADSAREQLERTGDGTMIALAHDLLGDILFRKVPQDAAGEYRKALDIRKRLLVKDPTDRVVQRGVSKSRRNIGDILQLQGEYQDALASYRKGLTIAQQLVNLDPANVGWQRDLAACHDGIGSVLRAEEKLVEALEAYGSSLEICRRLAASDPSNRTCQRDLSIAYDQIGDVRQDMDDLTAAEEAYRVGLEITQGLTARDRANIDLQMELSISCEKRGEVLRTQGRLEEALAVFRDSLETRRRLVALDPHDLGWLRDTSVTYDRIGGVLLAQKDFRGALDAYRSSLEISQQLVEHDPTNVDWQSDLLISHRSLGDVLHAQGDLREALEAYREALEIAEQLAARGPENPSWQRELSFVHEKLGAVREADGDHAGALAAYRKTLAIRARLDDVDADNQGSGRSDAKQLEGLTSAIRVGGAVLRLARSETQPGTPLPSAILADVEGVVTGGATLLRRLVASREPSPHAETVRAALVDLAQAVRREAATSAG